MNKLYVVYDETSVGGEAETDEEYSSRSPEYTEFKIKEVYLSDPDTVYYETIKVNFKPKINDVVYVILVRYSTGDTFGCSYGNGFIEGVYNDPKMALQIKEAIKSGYNEGKNCDKWPGKLYQKYHELRGEDLEFPWEGYFESLEDVEIHTKQIRK